MAGPAPKGIIIDPTKNTKYPVILSDELLGKASKETFTGIRYNPRPTLSSETAPVTVRLKQSANGSFNLGIEDKGQRWQYNGTRTSNDGKYVLVFDPTRKAFVLHRVDSVFHMDVTRTPTTSDIEKLRHEFPRLEVDKKHVIAPQPKKSQEKAPEKAPEKPSGAGVLKKPAKAKETSVFAKPRKPPAASLDKAKAREAMPPPPPPTKKKEIPKTETPKKKEPVTELPPLPMPSPSKASLDEYTKPARPPSPKKEEKKAKRRAAESDSDEEDDGYDPLQYEFPQGTVPEKPAVSTEFGRLPIQRRFSEFVRDHQQEDDDEVQDADAEFDAYNFEEAGDEEEEEEEDEELVMEDVQDSRLPSPVNHGNQNQAPDSHAGYGQTQSDLDADLEAELERELDGALGGNESESSVSEED